MRLKVTPFEALKKINELVEKGYKIQKNELENIRVEKVDKVFKMGLSKRNENEIDTDYHQAVFQWSNDSYNELKNIFKDFTILYDFHLRISNEKFLNLISNSEDSLILRAHKQFMIQMDILVSYYQDLSTLFKSPLGYDDKRNKLYYLDCHIQLESDSNEACLCKYMFENYAIGDLVPYEKIYEYITGEVDTYNHKKDFNIVKNAFGGINKKTCDRWKFPIFSSKKMFLSLELPPKIISNL